MQVTVNGEKKELPEGTTVLQLVGILGLNQSRLAVEVNQEIVTKARHGEFVINAGDQIEIVHFVGGG